MELLDAYKSYLKYPTIVVDFEAFGFLSLEEFVSSSLEALASSTLKTTNSVSIGDLITIYDPIRGHGTAIWANGNCSGTAIWANSNCSGPIVWANNESEDTSCYRKYLNQIMRKMQSKWNYNELYLTAPKIPQPVILNRTMRPRIRNPTSLRSKNPKN